MAPTLCANDCSGLPFAGLRTSLLCGHWYVVLVGFGWHTQGTCWAVSLLCAQVTLRFDQLLFPRPLLSCAGHQQILMLWFGCLQVCSGSFQTVVAGVCDGLSHLPAVQSRICLPKLICNCYRGLCCSTGGCVASAYRLQYSTTQHDNVGNGTRMRFRNPTCAQLQPAKLPCFSALQPNLTATQQYCNFCVTISASINSDIKQ